MKKLTLVLVLAGGLWGAPGDEAKIKGAGKALVGLADEVGKKSWDDLTSAGKAVADRHAPGHVMHAFKFRALGGLGIGEAPNTIKPDGMERKIQKLSNDPALSPGVLGREGPALARMAEVTAAIASVAVHHCPVQAKKDEKDPARWKELCQEMHKSAQELARAARAGDPAAVKTAARGLNNTCVQCHSIFRD
jgi:hypothetical protein